MSDKTVTIKLMSDEGHTEFTLATPDALVKLNELHNNGQRWVYVNGAVVSPSRLTEQILEDANSISVYNPLVGGVNDPITFDVALHIAKLKDENGEYSIESVSKFSRFPLILEFIPKNDEELRTSAGITIHVEEEDVITVISSRNALVQAIKAKLDEFANLEYGKFRETFNV